MKQLESMAPVINIHSTVLILGSMPGAQSLAKQQYYANPRNHFWPMMFFIFGQDPVDVYEERLRFLTRSGLALWDVLKFCEREGSLDSNIKKEVPNDLESLLDTYKQVKHIVFNGTKAQKSFGRLLRMEYFSGIRFHLLPSTSPTPGKNVKSFEEKVDQWAIITKLVGEGREGFEHGR